MFRFIIAVTFFTLSVWGGSLCPPRIDIYPCTCANVHIHKKNIVTIVTCQRLDDSDALNTIFPALRSMEIDRFYLYDSFWKANMLGSAGESQKSLPADWFTLLKIQEIEIIDSTLSTCFACQWKINCRNSVTTSFKVTNSSSSEKICILCEYGRGSKQPWTSCMTNLKEFHFNYGKLTSLGLDFFPMAMRELITLNLSYNQIVKIDSNVFKNLPQLIKLDLSHNAIEFFDHVFNVPDVRLEYLDLSWNFIKTIGAGLLPSLPHLKTLKYDNNAIVDLKFSEWEKASKSLRDIDLRNNPLHCDCSILWVNRTLSINVVFMGTCSTPSDYTNSAVRRASRLLVDRCDSAGILGTRKPTSRRPAKRRRA